MKETVYFGTYTRRLSKGITRQILIQKQASLQILNSSLLNQVQPTLPLTNSNTYTP